jgi:hypothetical protein
MLTVNYGLMFGKGIVRRAALKRQQKAERLYYTERIVRSAVQRVIKRQGKRRCETRILERK